MKRLNIITKPLMWLMALALAAAVAGCGGGSVNATGVGVSSAKAFTAYSLAGATGVINEAAKTIAVTVPYNTNVTALVASFTTTGETVKVGTTIQVPGTTPNNFTSPVVYTVIAANGTTVNYTVTVTQASGSAKEITAYSLNGATGTINQAAKTIAVTLPTGTSVTALVATFTTTGASVKVGTTTQVSGTTPNNFTSPVAYIVTAGDASTATYTVTVTVASATSKAITAYSIDGVAGTIDETAKTIAVALPAGTVKTALVATFVTTGASVSVGGTTQVSGTTPNDFTTSKAYLVTAGDASTATYNVTVTVAGSTTVLPGAGTNPTVLSSSPTNGDISVPTSSNNDPSNTVTGKLVIATFSAVMDPATITPVGVFTLKETIAGTNVSGAVTMNAANTMGNAANMVATFTPSAALTPNTSYTATVTTAAQTAGNVAITKTVAWSFTTKSVALTGQEPVDLLSILTKNFVILSKTGITGSGNTITGNIGNSSTAGSSITVGCADLVVGTGIGQMFTDDATPTGTCHILVPADTTTAGFAVADMGTAYTKAGGRLPADPLVDYTDLSGRTLNPGIYKTANGVLLNTGGAGDAFGVTLDCLGDSNAVFIFQIAGVFTVGNNAKVTLAGLCQAKNIFWVAQNAATVGVPIGTAAQFKGNILAFTTIAPTAGATINGRMLSQTQVTLISNIVGP